MQNSHCVVPLKAEYNRRGTKYRLKHRSDLVAMYTLQYNENSDIVGYDVFKIKRNVVSEIVTIGSRIVDPGEYECFPGDADYGQTAFSYTTLESATKKFDKLNYI